MEIYKSNIPIANIYYMLCYAFKDLTEKSIASVKPEEFENIYSLMAEIVIRGVSYRLKKGLLHSYEKCQNELSVVRGKIDICATVNCGSTTRHRLVCQYDEYTEDTLMNRILKSVMLLLVRADIKAEQAISLSRLLKYFGDVSQTDLSAVNWNKMVFNRNNREYRMLMNVCRIICENMLHSTEDGRFELVTFSEDNLNRLYEKFILNYYIRHYGALCPSASKIKWAVNGDTALLPEMHSDIMLTGKSKRLIIDAKFYTSSTQSRYGRDSVHSHNLYQIFTYVKNEMINFDGDVSGMLLYAKTQNDLIPNEGITVNMSGNMIFVKGLDLSVDFMKISQQLDEITKLVFTQ
jgi:5-methylcytosine-specific restriction enzyme subunit McrC